MHLADHCRGPLRLGVDAASCAVLIMPRTRGPLSRCPLECATQRVLVALGGVVSQNYASLFTIDTGISQLMSTYSRFRIENHCRSILRFPTIERCTD